MRSNEAVDVMKWAIALLLLCLLIGTTISFFYMLYDNTDRRIDSMEKAATSSNMERLYALRDTTDANSSNYEKFPLATNVASVITEFDEGDLIYISITTPNDQPNPDTYIYTYTGSNFSINGSTEGIVQSDIPVTMACRLLLQYSDCRAELRLGKFDPVTGAQSSDMNASGLLYIQIALYTDTLVPD